MALKVLNPPKAVEDAFKASMPIVASGMGGAAIAIRKAKQLSFAAPHPVYTARLEDVAGGRDLAETAYLVGWRFLIFEGRRAFAVIEIAAGVDGANARLSHVNKGPFVVGTIKKIRAAEKMRLVRAGDYDLCCLRIPNLFVMALWLKDRTGSRDIVLVMPPAHAELSHERVVLRGLPVEKGMPKAHGFTLDRFVELLQETAQDLMSDTPASPAQ
jgi:hypothetical protein